MAIINGDSVEKVTFNMPAELKMRVMALKRELKVSLSSIYNEAVSNYIKEKDADKWRQGVSLALKDRKYQEWSDELSADTGDFYDY